MLWLVFSCCTLYKIFASFDSQSYLILVFWSLLCIVHDCILFIKLFLLFVLHCLSPHIWILPRQEENTIHYDSSNCRWHMPKYLRISPTTLCSVPPGWMLWFYSSLSSHLENEMLIYHMFTHHHTLQMIFI